MPTVVFTLLLCSIFFAGISAQGRYYGCYPETVGARVFQVSAGSYDPNSVDPTVCCRECGRWSFRYAGLTQGRYCFCANQLPTASNVSESICNMTCTRPATTTTCGGKKHVSVYEAARDVRGLRLSVFNNPSAVVPVGSSVLFNLTYVDGPSDVTYALTYGDGSATPTYNNSDMLVRNFHATGEFVITATANNAVATTASVVVSVQAPAYNVTVDCPDYVITTEEFRCNVTVEYGTSLQMAVNYADGMLQEFAVADGAWFGAGPGIAQHSPYTCHLATAETIVIKLDSELSTDGQLRAVEFYAVGSSASVIFIILTPGCATGGSYCPETGYCQATCPGPVATCSATTSSFCPLAGRCNDSCTAPSRYSQPTSPTLYTVVHKVTADAVTTGYNFYLLPTPIFVSKGSVIGYYYSTGGRCMGGYNGTNDIVFTTVAYTTDTSPGKVFNIATGSQAAMSGFFRAVVTRPASTVLFHTFRYPGSFNVQLSVQNTLLNNATNVPQYANTTVIAQEAINDSTIDVAPFVATNKSIVINLLPHTGSSVTYLWDFGDGTPTVRTETPSANHTFTLRGCYFVNNTAYNDISSKSSNTTQICVEDELLNMTVNYTVAGATFPASFFMMLASGSGYTCYVSAGDDTNLQESFLTAPATATNWTHLYRSEGSYLVNVTCVNNVSAQSVEFIQIVQAAITNLRLLRRGAYENLAFYVTFAIDKGASPSFALTFDGLPLTTTFDSVTLTGTTLQRNPLPLGIHYVTINAWNLFGGMSINETFVIEEPIRNAVSTCSVVNETIADTPVEFSGNVSSGTSVNVTFEFNDGTGPVTIVMNTTARWPGIAFKTVHPFHYGGLYVVKVTISNYVDEFVFQHKILVFGKIDNITLVSNSPLGLVDGGALAEFKFESPTPPSGVQVMFNYGDGNVSPWMLFDIAFVYRHTYLTVGRYNVLATISSAVARAERNTTVTADIPAVTVRWLLPVPHASLNTAFVAGVTMASGSFIRVIWNFGDGSAPYALENTGSATTNLSMSAEHVFTKLGTYNMSARIVNGVGDVTIRYLIAVQIPVPSSIVFTSSGAVSFPPGLVQYNVTLPSGAAVPTSAWMVWKYGDGTESNPISLPFSASGSTYTTFYKFQSDGDFNTTLIIFNLASNQTFVVTGGAYIPIDGFYVQPVFRPTLPVGGPFLPGFGTLNNKFPLNYNVTFQMNFVGTGARYNVDVYTLAGSPVMTGSYTTNPISLPFTAAGQYRVLISARNPLSSGNDSVVIEMIESVSGVTLRATPTADSASVPRTVVVNVTRFGSTSCLTLNYGDGFVDTFGADNTTCKAAVKGPITQSITVRHVYTKNNAAFTITATAFDVVGTCANPTAITSAAECTAQTVVTTSASDCSYPTVVIKNRAPVFTSPATIYRSLQLIIDASVTIACATTLVNVKEWTCESIDESTSQALRTVNISLVAQTGNAMLSIPPKFLPLGLYRFTLRVQVGTSGLFTIQESTHVRVVATPLVVSIAPNGMSLITRGYYTDITLSPALYSYDPDIDRSLPQEFTNFIWFCREVNEVFPTNSDGSLSKNRPSLPYTDAQLAQLLSNSTNLGGCFRQGPGLVGVTGQGNLTFSGRNMLVNGTYVFRVTVVKGDRNSTAELMLTVVPGSPPEIEIGCLDPLLCRANVSIQVINPTNRISLGVKCAGSAVCPPGLSFNWTISRLGLNGAYLPVYTCEDYSIGCRNPEIAISSKLFQTGFSLWKGETDYRIGVVVQTSSGDSGQAFIDFMVNVPPMNGNCSVEPASGVSSVTQFVLSCADWMDVNGIKLYQFYSVTKGQTIETQLGYSSTGILKAMSFAAGPAADNYNVYVFVRVFDELGAFTIYNISSVQVFPVSASVAETTITTLLTAKTVTNPLLVAVAEGNLQATNSMFASIADLLNQASNYSINTYGNDSSTSSAALKENTAYQEARNDRATLREMMIQSIANNTASTIEAVQLCSSTLAAITQQPTEVTRQAQMNGVAAIQNFVNVMNDVSPTTTIEDLQIAAASIAATVGNLLSSINNAIDDGTLNDIAAATKTKFFEYDADWESPRAGFAGMLQSDMEKGLKLETNSLAQKDSANTSVPSLLTSMDSMSSLIISRLVSGENAVNITTANLNMTLIKTNPQDLFSHSQLQGDAAITMPTDWCSISPPEVNCSGSDPVAAKLITTPRNTFTNFPDKDVVNAESMIVTFDLYSSNGTKMTIENTEQEIEILIPRPGVPAPVAELQHVEMSTEDDRVDLAYFRTNVTKNDSSLHIAFDVIDPTVQLLVLVRYDTYPSLNETDGYDFMQLVPADMANISDLFQQGINPYAVLVDNTIIRNRTGNWYIGLRQLNITEVDTYSVDNPPPKPAPFTGRLTTNFTLVIYSSGCYYTQPNAGRWYAKGCRVGPKTTPAKTYCYCNHLTSFGGGFAVQPNTIDFAFVMSHADFLSNPTLYIMEMVVCVMYIFGFIWAKWKDKKDLLKYGITPLADNDPRDKYLYEVAVSTGLRKNAGTDSKVFFILSGEDEETDARAFEDDQRKIFRRGATDYFLLAVPRPLGPLHYMRIWHDNSGSGSSASWYLNYVVVRDVQTREKYQFVVNQWLAVEEDDGQISRCVPVSGLEKMVETEHLFSSKGKKGLTDDHIWFSVFARPARSRFTRLQRLSCCLCLLFTSMLANAMFYGVVSSSTANGFQIGPFSLSAEQVYVGVISNMITFPVNFLIAFLFKRSRPYRKHKSRVEEALMRMREKRGRVRDVERCETSLGRRCDLNPEPTVAPRELSDQSQPEIHPELWDTCNPDDNPDMPDAEKKKRLSLPWWCVIIAWILLWIVVGLCVAFVTFYGIMFQDLKCKKWITSMFISFFTSVLLTQPIKVLLLALFFALVFKKPFDDEEPDEMEDEEDPQLAPDEMYLHDATINGPAKTRSITFTPPDPAMLMRAREKRLKELKMYEVIREIAIYSFYVWIIIVISYEFRDVNSYRFKENMRVAFVQGGSSSNTMALTDIQTMDDFWEWLNDTVAPSLRAGNWYNDQRPVGLRGFLGDYVSRIMGFATLRQLRIKKGLCSVPPQMRRFTDRCRATYTFDNEDLETYNVGWTPLPDTNDTEFEPPYEYVYRHGNELDTMPYYGTLGVYSGGGYVAQLRGDRNAILDKIADLKASGWIDTYTRAVFIEFAVYNPNVNLFGAVTMIAELMQSGGFTFYYRFEPMNLLGSQSGMAVFQLAIKAIFLLFIVFFIVREVRSFWKQRHTYITQFWNIIEILVIGLSVGGAVTFAYRYIVTLDLLDIFKKSGGNAYMRFQWVGYWNETLLYMLGLVVFWSTIKFIKLLRFNKTMSILGSTLKYAAEPLFWFSVTFLIMFFAFMQFFYLTYNSQFFTFSTIVQTTEMCMQMLVGKFDFNELLAGGNLGTLMFFLYMVVCFFIMLTMFVTIVNEAFAAVQDDLKLQSNEHELVDFIIGRFVDWTGLKSFAKKLMEIGHKKQNQETLDPDAYNAQLVENFNTRMEALLLRLSDIGLTFANETEDIDQSVSNHMQTYTGAMSSAPKSTIYAKGIGRFMSNYASQPTNSQKKVPFVYNQHAYP